MIDRTGVCASVLPRMVRLVIHDQLPGEHVELFHAAMAMRIQTAIHNRIAD